MADNIQLNSGSGGDQLSAHDLGSGVKMQRVIGSGIESTNNTTTTPLASGATYTGTWEQNRYSDVMVSCQTDNAGTLYFDFSPDGTNVNSFPVAGFEVASGVHEFHTAVKGPRYFRARLVNDSGAQSYLRLYTYYGTFRQGNLPVNSTISADADATVVRTISPDIDLAYGKIDGMVEGEKFGEIKLIDAADCPCDIWAYGSDDVESGATKTYPTSSGDLFISSSSASDTNVDVLVYYIDTDGAEQTVSVNTNGQTPVDLGVDGYDAYRAIVTGATTAVGDLYINTENNHTSGVPDDPATVLAFIRAGYGQTQIAGITVPLGKQMRIKHIDLTIARASGNAGSAEIHLAAREFGKTWIVKRALHLTTSLPFSAPVAGLIFPARTSVKLILNDVSDTDTNCHASFIYELVDV